MGVPNTIFGRNKTCILDQERMLWRMLCDTPSGLKKHVSGDCVMLFPSGQALTNGADSSPTIDEALDGYEPWSTYRFDAEPRFVEIGMMAASVAYTVTLARLAGDADAGRGRMEETSAAAVSVWRQGADGEWELCMHHLAEL
ncbi:hypothetical protein MKZ38_001935 [Zalerion maritima]|uniref:DUF4440 domain-containing protein n=1 Tax=Zalerion maritima TaxID=339359 RepID=A0AAD5RFX9_9PEZI|nr:hypothetical protein MKZ38_001935 [Zalerion maritima]